MVAPKLIGIGLILILALPGLVAASDGRRTHSIFHLLLGLGGLAWSWSAGGLHALALSLASGAVVLIALALGVALTQKRWGKRIMIGGEMKMMTAAATWVSPIFAIGIVALSIGAVVLWLVGKTSLQNDPSRPDMTPFVIGALLIIFIAS